LLIKGLSFICYLNSQKYSWELAAHLDGDKGEQGADAVDGGAQQD
jgi:hypothetical protein